MARVSKNILTNPFETALTDRKTWNQNKEDVSAYKTSRWAKLRAVHLRENPYCVHCQNEGVTKVGRVVDHILPVRLGGDMWEPSNLQTLCDSHHNIKSNKERWQIESR